jgi:Secretion system C-terminal sorting domain/FG-GAP-like repeat
MRPPFTRFLAFLLLTFTFLANTTAQMPHFERLNIPFSKNGTPYKSPLAGGINSAQPSPADLNNDGVLDLVIFDRVGDVISTYINKGTVGESDYEYAPEYACFFPKCVNWMLLRDYDGDGAADIFCNSLMISSQDVQVFKGYFENNILKFKPFFFTYTGCALCNPLDIYYPDEVPGFFNNLPIANSDLPSIHDIDGDGDLDILTFEASVGGHVWLIENKSVEMGFGRDSLKYELVDRCWGRFYESGLLACENSLSPSSDSCSNGFAGPMAVDDRDGAHPGSTVTNYDQDGDGDQEIILGDISFACLNMMTNGGNANTAWMNAQDTHFPSYNTGVELTNFPAAFIFDVNNDGVEDLIACPNSKNIIEDQKNVWFYENTGSNTDHVFELKNKSLFTGEMVDMGSGSHPVFVDVNQDGLLDIVAGNNGFYTPGQSTNARLYLFLNVGSSDAPSFDLVDSDWAGLSQFAPDNYEFTPSFGDLDGDGDLDMLVGCESGYLFSYENTAGVGNQMQMQYDANPFWVTLDVGKSSAPTMFDLDNDGLLDLIIGERQGNLNFFKNTGTIFNPTFSSLPTIDNLGKINTRVFPESIGYSNATVIQTTDGQTLVAGTLVGRLEAYKSLGATADSFPVISELWGGLDVGARSQAAIADINNDGILDILVGNNRGGLSLFSNVLIDCTDFSADTQNIQNNGFKANIIPNPAHDVVKVTFDNQKNDKIKWRVFNLLGQFIVEGNTTANYFNFNVIDWKSGLYLLEINKNEEVIVAKLVVD